MMKIILLGKSNAGKTSILRRYKHDTYDGELIPPTIGVDFYAKTTELVDGTRLKMDLWDCAGQERFNTIVPSFYRGALGVVYVYDANDRKSFDDLPHWVNDWVNNNTFARPIVSVVAAKTDLKFLQRVSEKEGGKFAKARKGVFWECSALSGYNVNKIFDTMAECAFMNEFVRPRLDIPGDAQDPETRTIRLPLPQQLNNQNCAC